MSNPMFAKRHHEAIATKLGALNINRNQWYEAVHEFGNLFRSDNEKFDFQHFLKYATDVRDAQEINGVVKR